MNRMIRAGLLLGALCLVTPALGDDSSAMLGVGGIVLTKNADIRMATEDLYLSPKQVKVHYTFVNDSGKDIDTMVAFPLPDVNNYDLAESPMGTTTDTTPNFVGFALTVDGKKITPTPEERAVLNGKDVSAQVRAAGLPLNIVIGGGYEKLAKLSAVSRAALIKAGLIEDEGDNNLHAKWTTLTKFYWQQHFPAGGTVTVDHTYQPVTGQTFFGATMFDSKESMSYYTQYCIDSGTKATILARLAEIKNQTSSMLNQYTTDFVIVTANNWKGPIGKFHLTIDKLKPDNTLSLCWDGNLQKTGPTRFESTLTNFAPKKDIQLLVLEKPSP